MKNIIFAIIFVSSLYGYKLNWIHDYDKALYQAKKEHKDIYLFVGADKCRFCDRFKEMTLSKSEVIERLKKEFILLYMSRDQHKIPQKFATKGVPRHYFLTSEGKIIHDDRGSREVDGFYDMLDEVELKKDN